MVQRNWRIVGIAILFVATPLAFATIRAFRTGDDFRYLWVALASLLSGFAVIVVGNEKERMSNRVAMRSAAVFIVSTVVAVFAASLLGARVGPASVVVGSAFGFCYAAACGLHLFAQRRL